MKDEKPLVVHGRQLILPLGKLWHLKIEESQFVIEHMLVVNIHQLHFVPKTVLGVFIVGEDKIQDSNRIDTFEPEIPKAFLPLILYRESSVEYTPVLEELLLGLLHLNDERLALLVLAVDIEDGTAVAIAIAEVLAIEIGKITHHFLAFEERVEEANQQILVKGSSEQLLKAEVRVGIDIFTFSHFFYLTYASICHILAN